MKRRDVIPWAIGALIPLGGCQDILGGDGEGETTSEASLENSMTGTDSPSSGSSGTDCPPRGALLVYRPAEIPASATVRDAEEDGLLEHDGISSALSKAAESTEPSRNDDVIIARSRSKLWRDVGDEVQSLFGDDREVYVEYRNDAYRLVYTALVC